MKYFDIDHHTYTEGNGTSRDEYRFYNVFNGEVFAEVTLYNSLFFSYSVLEDYDVIRYQLRDVLIGIINNGGEKEGGVYSFDKYIKPLFRDNKLGEVLS